MTDLSWDSLDPSGKSGKAERQIPIFRASGLQIPMNGQIHIFGASGLQIPMNGEREEADYQTFILHLSSFIHSKPSSLIHLGV